MRLSIPKAWTRGPCQAALVVVLFVSAPVPESGALTQSAIDLAVRFSPGAGTFVGTETVTLSVGSRADIHYTLDGSLPTASSPVYRDPITLDTSTRLRAVAIAPIDPAASTAISRPTGPVATEVFLRVSDDARQFTSHLPVILIHTFESGALSAFGTEHQAAALLVLEPTPTDGIVGRATLDARIGIHVRGQTSRAFPKKQYAIELRDDGDETDRGRPVLGLPSGADWVLSDPLTYDRSLIRNALAYALSNAIGRYAPRTRFAEAFLVDDGGDVGMAHFLGFFTLIEKIGRDADRVDVNRLPQTAVALPALSGGYIVSIDKGAADFVAAGRAIQFVYPDAEDMARPERRAQVEYIRHFIDSFGQAANAPTFTHPVTGQHYEEFVDVDAWIDHHILNVITKNVDGMRFSTYFHKDRGGRLVAGPVWDFDRSLGTPYDARATYPEEWTSSSWGGRNAAEGWWASLFRDPAFRSRYRNRVKELLNGPFSADNLDRLVDGLVLQVGDAADRNFRRWTWTPPQSNSHAAEIAQLREFLRRRTAWIATRIDIDF